jgi:hypothetical protein
MKRLLIAIACIALCAPGLVQSGWAQSSDEPASKDDVILYMRTMHSHDLFLRTMQVQVQTMQQLLREQILKDKGSVPADFDTHMKKAMDDLVKTMPIDEITEAMIPAYQKHFTKSDIEAMNTFYSSPVGQKVLEELPAVMQEGSQAAMPIMSKYLTEWKTRMEQEAKEMEKDAPQKVPIQQAPKE